LFEGSKYFIVSGNGVHALLYIGVFTPPANVPRVYEDGALKFPLTLNNKVN